MRGRGTFALGSALLSVVTVMVAGCGTAGVFLSDASPRVNEPSACLDAPEPANAGTLVVLDWNGGWSTMRSDKALAAFDVSTLNISDNEAATEFQADVLNRVQLILCDLNPLDVAVIAGDSEDYPGATIVHLTSDQPLGNGKHIGQSDFDPCNDREDDAAVIWGGALAAYMPPLSYDQWVNVVANTTAHEIGHTLGFTHPSEETVARLLPVPSEEIMRATVKPSELSGEQRFLIEQTTCPGLNPGDGSYALHTHDEVMGG